jgi:hypothetical protein
MDMSFVKSISVLLFMPLMNLATPRTEVKSYLLQGSIVNKESGKPLADVYLYTVKGEEEAVTNRQGVFKLETWQKLPVTLFVHAGEHENVRVVVSNPKEIINIKL